MLVRGMYISVFNASSAAESQDEEATFTTAGEQMTATSRMMSFPYHNYNGTVGHRLRSNCLLSLVNSLQRVYGTLSPDLCVMHHIVFHPSHYSNTCIGYQSSNVLSTNSLLRRTKFDYTSSQLAFSSTLVSINPFALCIYQILSYSLFHLPKQQPHLGHSTSPSQMSGIPCRSQSGKHLHNLHCCAV